MANKELDQKEQKLTSSRLYPLSDLHSAFEHKKQSLPNSHSLGLASSSCGGGDGRRDEVGGGGDGGVAARRRLQRYPPVREGKRKQTHIEGHFFRELYQIDFLPKAWTDPRKDCTEVA